MVTSGASGKTKAPWVIIGPEPYLATCKRCGEHIPKPTFPVSLRAFTRFLEAAAGLHEDCEEVSKK